MRLILAATALLAATPACATDWVLATTAGNKASATYIDRDSVSTTSDGHIVVSAFYLRATDAEGGLAAMVITQEYDCGARRYRRLLMRGYRVDGSVVGAIDTPTEWKLGDGPGSQGVLLMDFVCAKRMLEPNRVGLGAELPLASGRRELLKGN